MTRTGSTVQHPAHHPVRRVRALRSDPTRSRAARLLAVERRTLRGMKAAA